MIAVTASILDYPDKYKYPLQLSLFIEFFVSKVLFNPMNWATADYLFVRGGVIFTTPV